jgi:hypothetical protein
LLLNFGEAWSETSKFYRKFLLLTFARNRDFSNSLILLIFSVGIALAQNNYQHDTVEQQEIRGVRGFAAAEVQGVRLSG